MILLSIHQVSASLVITTIDESTCQSTSCSSNKLCIDHPNGNLCICPPGKVGPECEFNDPCLNVTAGFCGFGYCNPTTTGAAECVCQPGIQGHYCMLDIDECENDPCQSNEMCFNTLGSFICVPRRRNIKKQHPIKVMIDWDSVAIVVAGTVMFVIFLIACSKMALRCYSPNRSLVLPAHCTSRVAPQRRPLPVVVGWI
uniref:EGF-like domain-containing protein n=1 Tax=Panagrellus redivivus TaxID=6233 RepID=A0A7E4W6L5_PANRE